MKPSLLLLIMLAAAACKKGSTDDTQAVLPAVAEFDSCSCSASSTKEEVEYIKAIINGVPVCFDSPSNLPDSFASMMRHGLIYTDTGAIYYDNVYMIRHTADGKWQLAIFLENTHAFTKHYPYDLPRANSEVCEIGELQLNNLWEYDACDKCPGGNRYSYYNPFFRTYLKMTATGFTNHVFEGNFSGELYSGFGKTAKIEDGKFRIKLIDQQQDISIP